SGCVERLRAEGGQPVHFIGALASFLSSAPLTMEELRGHDTDDEERREDEPVERIADDQRVIGCEEKPVQKEEGGAGERQPKRASTPHTAGQHDEHVDERGVRLVQVRPEREHGQRDRRQAQKGSDPRPRACASSGYWRGAASVDVANRYPTPGSVWM